VKSDTLIPGSEKIELDRLYIRYFAVMF